MKDKILAAFLILICVRIEGATNSAASPSYADVSAAYAAASAGDVILIPAGTGYWTNLIHIIPTKHVTFMGAGMTNGTVLYNNSSGIASSFPEFFYITNSTAGPTPGVPVRISSMEFRRGNTNGITASRSVIACDEKSMLIRLDHLNFNNVNTRPFATFDVGTNSLGGVLDHWEWYNPNNSAGIFFDGATYGNEAWTKSVPFGTTNMGFFLESGFFTNGVNRAITDGRAGQYYVSRFNTNYNCSFENHEGFGRKRAGRGQLIYGNYFWAGAASENATLNRGGTYYIYSNTIAGSVPGVLRFQHTRSNSIEVPVGEACGTNVWDFNDPYEYATGTHTGTNGALVLTDTNTFWGTNNYWVGFTAINLSCPTVSTGAVGLWAGQTNCGLVTASTSNTITFLAAENSGSQLHWTNGQSYSMRRVISAFDQPGLGAGDLVVTTSDIVPGTNQTTGLPGWTHNVLDPSYAWANIGTSPGTNISSPGAYYTITNGSNYLYGVPPGYVDLVPYPHPFAVYMDALNGPGIIDGGATNYPTIVSIANQTISQDTHTASLAVTLGSGLTNVANYTVTTSSTTTTLVPNSGTNYVFGGSGANRTLVVYPAAGQFGSTLITLTVTDEVSHQGQTTFQLTVTQTGSLPPTITSIANITTTVNHISSPSTFTVGDPVDDPATLIVTATSSNQSMQNDSLLFIGGSGASRNISGEPGPLDGVSTVTVTVQNSAGLTANTTFTITGTGNSSTLSRPTSRQSRL